MKKANAAASSAIFLGCFFSRIMMHPLVVRDEVCHESSQETEYSAEDKDKIKAQLFIE